MTDSPSPPLPETTAATIHGTGPAIEAANAPGETDEFDTVEGYETASELSSLDGTTSAASSIYANTFEHGRRYYHYKNSRYPLPNDDLEQNREDMKHAMMLELTDGKLFYAPIGENPQQILDIGTGTGIWAIDAGDRFPSAHVRGIDLTPIQPVWVPPNVDFLVDNCTRDWLAKDIDYVHFRIVMSVVTDVPLVLSHCFASLKPGGWVECQELSGQILCDDATMPNDDPLKYMYARGLEAFKLFGMDVGACANLEPALRGAGFVNIQCVVKKAPIGVWAGDKTMRLIGLYQKMAIADLMPAIAGRPFEALGIPQAEREVILARARRSMDDTSVHRYFPYYFWYAQKPEV